MECPQECSSSAFTGVASYSQLSAKATNQLLGSHTADIINKYENAVEVLNRVSGDSSFDLLYTISDILIYSQNLLNNFDASIDILSKYSEGLNKFSDEVIRNDTELLQQMLTNFWKTYSEEFMTKRWGALTHLADVTSQLADIKEMFSSENSINILNNLVRSKQFYKSLLTQLNRNILSMELYGIYMDLVLLAEAKLSYYSSDHTLFYPDSFYESDADKVQCIYSYKNLGETMKMLGIYFTYVTERIVSWLEKQSNQSLAVMNTIAPDTTTAYYDTNAPDTKNGNEEGSLWELLRCSNCSYPATKEQWMEAIDAFNVLESRLATSCLLRYEESLKSVLVASQNVIQAQISFTTPDNYNQIVSYVVNKKKLIEALIERYLTDDTLKYVCTESSELLKNVTVYLQLVAQSLKTETVEWQNNVNTWQYNVSKTYLNIVNSLFNLSYFLSTRQAFTNTISQIRMWKKPVVQVVPGVAITYNIANKDKLIKSVTSSVYTFLNYSAATTVKKTMSNNYAIIRSWIAENDKKLQALLNEWSTSLENFNYLLKIYLNTISLNVDVIR